MRKAKDRMTSTRIAALGALVMLLSGFSALSAEEFSFKYRVGDKYRILSRVDEDVYINGQYSYQADILNRISVEIKDVENGKGLLEGRFSTSETKSGQVSVYEMNRSYFSRL